MAGIFSNIFSGIAGKASMKGKAIQQGFDKQELQGFMKMARSLNQAQSRVDANAEGFGPQFKSKVVNEDTLNSANAKNASTDTAFFDRKFNQGENLYTQEFTKDQVKGFVDAFKVRQEEVFGRRAQPGIAQTRLV